PHRRMAAAPPPGASVAPRPPRAWRPIIVRVATTIALGIAFPARAAVLATSPVFRSGKALECLVVNGGTKPVGVTIDMVDLDGGIELTKTSMINPDTADRIGNGSGTFAVSYCRFTIDGSKKGVRGAYCLETTLGGVCEETGDAR